MNVEGEFQFSDVGFYNFLVETEVPELMFLLGNFLDRQAVLSLFFQGGEHSRRESLSHTSENILLFDSGVWDTQTLWQAGIMGNTEPTCASSEILFCLLRNALS